MESASSRRSHRAQFCPAADRQAWARRMVARRPFADEDALLAASNEIWRSLPPIRLDGSVSQSSANRRVTRIGTSPEPVSISSVRAWSSAGATKRGGRRRCGEEAPWRMRIGNTSGVSIASLLCAPRVSLRQRFWRFFSGGCNNDAEPNCAKPPSSSGRLRKSG